MVYSNWLKKTDKKAASYQCPACETFWRFIGPRNPMRWTCPECGAVLTWKETEGFDAYPVEVCTRCGAEMETRQGRYSGPFLGCSNYPDCKTTRHKTEWRLRRKVDIALAL